MKPKLINGILLVAAILLWIGLIAFHLAEATFTSVFDETNTGQFIWVGTWSYRIVLACFLIINTLLLQRWFGHIEKLDVTTILWRLFITGMSGITLVMLVTFANRTTAGWTLHKYATPIFFGLGFYALIFFFLACVFIYRRFILYPRTRRKMIAWQLFMVFLGLGLVFLFLPNGLGITISYIPFAFLTLFLAANVRWVAYLNFSQKLRTLGLLTLILLVIITYIIAASNLPRQLGVRFPDDLSFAFVLYVIGFTLLYTISSILVTFFNLPTSSIFEKESFEIASFSKINQAIQSNLDFTDIMNTLLEASLMTGNARAGWIEMMNPDNESSEVMICKRISIKEIEELQQGENLARKAMLEGKPYLVRNIRKHRALRESRSRYRCIMAIPVVSNNRPYGAIIVVNELVNSFEDVTLKSIASFAEQAGIALENARLVQESIEVERYREQLKIAKEVQQQLLPRDLPRTDRVAFVAMSENAYEVGGDYYDVVSPEKGLYCVAIGDVSGKGTTAAFYMAEIKGIFHALSHINLGVRDFIVTANQALSECMQKGFFMTLTYLQVDMEMNEVHLLRAGHCTTFFYRAVESRLYEMCEGTLGLGIMRRGGYDQLVGQPQQIHIAPGDFLVLYTDGIIEARSKSGEEFGVERLRETILRNSHESGTVIAAEIVSAVKFFTHADIQDDYTVLVIRFT
ncbi:MAG: hypothetical protein OHK0039_01700 [Bacteroidia bacterium]